MRFREILGLGICNGRDIEVKPDNVVITGSTIDSRLMTVEEARIYLGDDDCLTAYAIRVEVTGNFLKAEPPDHEPPGSPGTPDEIEDLKITAYFENGGIIEMVALTEDSIEAIRKETIERLRGKT